MAFDLATLAQVKSYLGITASTYDTILTSLENNAEVRMARLCNRPDGTWLTASKTEYLTGWGQGSVCLTYTPITAVASVNITIAAGTSVSVTLTDMECDGIPIASLTASLFGRNGNLRLRRGSQADIVYRFDSGLPLSPSFRAAFPTERDRVVVAYTGGYANQAGVPLDLNQTAVELTADLFGERLRDSDLKAETLGNYTWERKSQQEIDDGLRSDLAPYVRNPL